MYFIKRITFLSFVLLALVVLYAALFIGNTALDIHMHDTYLVIGYDFVLLHFFFFFLLCALVYFGLRKKTLNIRYFYLHFIFSILGLALMCAPFVFSNLEGDIMYSDFSSWSSAIEFFSIHRMTLIGLCIFILGQFTFIINLALHAFKKSEK